MFWQRASEAGAIAAAVASVLLSYIFKMWLPEIPFINRMSYVFLIALVLAIGLSLLKPGTAGSDRITTEGVSYRTTTGFNISSFVVVAILIALYATWW
jgi:SSS family solute:Na+ symporter